MFCNIKQDMARYYKIELGDINPGWMKIIRLLMVTPGLQAVIVYRFGRWVNEQARRPLTFFVSILSPVYKLLSYLIIKLYDINISLNSKIGKGFYIGHFSGIEVRNVDIGRNCSIHQHVKIEVSNLESNSSNNDIIIGNNVWIGAHAKIYTAIVIADGATIAAGSRVDNDINSAALVMGVPARIIIKNYDNNSLL